MEEDTRNVRIFKLSYSGTLLEPVWDTFEKTMALFNINNIISIHIKKQKRMYIWVGTQSTQSLRYLITQIRAITTRDLTELVTLRYINVDAGSEPPEFFTYIKEGSDVLADFNKEVLGEQLFFQEKVLAPKKDEINELKAKADEYYLSREFEKVITISKALIKLADEIGDEALKADQEEFLKETKGKYDVHKFKVHVEEESKIYQAKFEEVIKEKGIIEAHVLIKEFKEKYENEIDLKSLEIACDIIAKDEELWNNHLSKQEDMKNELNQLEDLILSSIEKEDILLAEEKIEKVRELMSSLIEVESKEKWAEIEEKIIEVRKKIDAEFGNNKALVEKLEIKIKEHQEKGHYTAIVKYCKQIVTLCKLINDIELSEKYLEVLKNIKEDNKAKEALKSEELEKLVEKAKEIEKIIEIEDDTMPLIEEFSVDEILGDLSDDINVVLEQVGSLLEEHRVEIKEDLKNKAILTSASGEIVELDQDLKIEKTEENKEEVTYNVQSGLTNPFDDVLEEAILTDLIPYNFEITNIELNGKKVEELPDKTLSKDGMELKWKIENIQPKEKVEINYDLRRRISRTIIFLSEGDLKIIKTHSNLNPLEIKGLYEAKLRFTNPSSSPLNGVVVEDIIPLYYLHFVKEPTNILPNETSSTKMGELVKWNVGSLGSQTLNYHYRLIELFRLEELKISTNDLRMGARDYLLEGNLTEALKSYEKIIDQLDEFNK